MTAPVVQFDYGTLPANQVKKLRTTAKEIRSHMATMTPAIIEIGRNLLIAKQALRHGRFSQWVETECGFTLRTAQNYMRVAEFVAGKSESVSLLAPSTIYALASKKMPPAVVQKVLQLLDSGHVPTECDVHRMLDAVGEIAPERSKTPDAGLEAQRADDLASQLLASVGPDLARSLVEGPWDQIGASLRLKLNHEFVPSSERHRPDTSSADVALTPMRVDLVRDPVDENRYRPKVIESDYPELPACLRRTPVASDVAKQLDQASTCPTGAGRTETVQSKLTDRSAEPRPEGRATPRWRLRSSAEDGDFFSRALCLHIIQN